ncbi:hypothetical protein [Mycolicibacterium fortuitum]|uniref:hypothetical protein n=1 Tax=Mycolicibacterium fortuitum TaxID=1766 RepID=UPI001CDC2FC9|nr:hypothetical protein [Mycolicibacterium fortuitum]UBV14816.1 hypothetical protein H8Z57_29665 [Mycolicibacterium fortuitum]
MGAVTLVGDRQTGKTHGLLAVAVADAIRGRRVVYQAQTLTVAYHHMRDVAEMIPETLIRRVFHTNGNYRIELFNGGVVWFRSHGQEALPASRRIDTYLLDDWASSWVPKAASAAEFLYVAQMAEDA